jgi:acyl-CoA thioester hydrolase
VNRITEFPSLALIESRFRWPVRVYYEDTDALGMVYHANYLRYLERARVEWLEAAGVFLPQLAERDRGAFVVRRMQLDYVKSAQLGEKLHATVSVRAVKACTADLRQTVETLDADITYLAAEVQIAYVDIDKRRPAAMPEALRNALINEK